MPKNKEQVDIKTLIEESKLFDKNFYLKTYRDVRLADVTPLEHYIQKGMKEDRRPNEHFDPIWYREFYTDVKEDESYPFIHYILFGKDENRFQNESENNQYQNINKELVSEEIIEHVEIIEYTEDERVILESGLFDENYYLNSYEDIKQNNLNPLKHFCKYGWKEDRNPSKLFDTLFYLQRYKDIKDSGQNPLLHYIKYGQKENREIVPENIYKKLSFKNISRIFNKEVNIPKFTIDKPIDIIIPVYNGYEYLNPLFESLKKNTTLAYRLLVCDDKSSDERVVPFLENFVEKNTSINIKLLKNEKNLGFIKTVNKLSKYADNHFVLLNTDTEVPTYWIERLMYPIFKMENIATTTPFTNAGTICSFPNYLEDNKILFEMDINKLDNYFKNVNFENTYIEIPTGVGFCMGVNKELVDKIGMFDEIFGKGYGEENDLCQRAIKNGYKNIHVPNLFVYHKHGGSFPSEEKKRLIETNLKTLNKKHNTFDKQVQTTIKNNSLELLRNIIYFKIASKEKYSSFIFDHNLGGGANHYLDDLIKEKIKKGEIVCLVRFDYNNTKDYIIKIISDEKEFSYASTGIFNLMDTLQCFSFNELFLNSFVSYPNVEDILILISKIKTNKNKLIVPIHDYFPICPSYTLLNDKTKYCEVPSDLKKCDICLKLHNGEFKAFEKETDIKNWRSIWGDIFKITDKILCFSEASNIIFKKAYPQYFSKVIVIPHNIKGRYQKIYNQERIKKIDKNIIGVLGGINEAKGAKVVKDLVKYIEKNKINAKVVLIGQISIQMQESDYFNCTGRYKIEELAKIVIEQNITQFFIPSIWPETFSYTTDEIMQLGYPLTVFNLGAPAERVKNYKLGKVIKIGEINELFI